MKILIREHEMKESRIERDFRRLGAEEPRPEVMSMFADSFLPLGFVYGRKLETCANEISRMYEERDDFRSELKRAVELGEVSVADLSRAINCCVLPSGNESTGIRKILEICHEVRKREQDHAANGSSAGL